MKAIIKNGVANKDIQSCFLSEFGVEITFHNNDLKVPYIIDNTLIYNRLLIAKRGNIGMIHIIVCEDSDMFI